MRNPGLMFVVFAVAATSGCGYRSASPKDPSTRPAAKDASAANKNSLGVKAAVEKEPYAVFETSMGKITARLLPEAAPKTVENFIGLATGGKSWNDPATGRSTRRPLYDGTLFFRVIPGFIIQGGSPLNGKFGGPGYFFEDEFSSKHLFTKPGLLAMANAGPNTNGSQFFMTLAPVPWFSSKHTVFGEVVEGLEVADAISRAAQSPDGEDAPLKPVVLRNILIEYRVPSAAGTGAKNKGG